MTATIWVWITHLSFISVKEKLIKSSYVLRLMNILRCYTIILNYRFTIKFLMIAINISISNELHVNWLRTCCLQAHFIKNNFQNTYDILYSLWIDLQTVVENPKLEIASFYFKWWTHRLRIQYGHWMMQNQFNLQRLTAPIGRLRRLRYICIWM